VGHIDAKAQGFGGWSLSANHVFDVESNTFYGGDGRRYAFKPAISTVAGTGVNGDGHTGDGSPATQVALGWPAGADVAWASDGSYYVTSLLEVRRVDRTGTLTLFAGGPTNGSFADGPATQAGLQPAALAVGPDGSVYVLQGTLGDAAGVRRIGTDVDHTVTTLAGGPAATTPGYVGDGIPAIDPSVRFNAAQGLAVGPDGTVYIADTGNQVIRRIRTDGILQTIAGTPGMNGPAIDNVAGLQAQFNTPSDVAVGPDGSLYVTDTANAVVRRMTPDGLVHIFAGSMAVPPGAVAGDGLPAACTASQTQCLALSSPKTVTVSPDGTVFVTDDLSETVWSIDPLGIAHQLAGIVGAAGFDGDQGAPLNAQFFSPRGLSVDAEGNLLVADMASYRVRLIGNTYPGYFASKDGSEFYNFDVNGRHLTTVDGLGRATMLTFGYDPNGLLSSVTDVNGNVTAIDRSQPSHVVITAPHGQKTTLALDSSGYLASVTDPNQENFTLSYVTGASAENGLLATFQPPNGFGTQGFVHKFAFSPEGYLLRDTDPAGASESLTRTVVSDGWDSTFTSGEGRTTSYRNETLSTNADYRTFVSPSGAMSTWQRNLDGSEAITAANGTVTTLQKAADPRFGMMAPYVASETVTTPSGLTYSVASTRVATVQGSNPQALATQTDNVTVNGVSTFTTAFTSSTNQRVVTGPVISSTGMPRTVTTTLDSKDRSVQIAVPGLDPVAMAYDDTQGGRLSAITQGARTTSYGYYTPDTGFVKSITDPLGKTVTYSQRDPVGRITSTLLQDGTSTIASSYDLDGNLAKLTPPAGAAHGFDYTPIDLLHDYLPPNLGFSGNTTYAYNADRRLLSMVDPDGTITRTYDSAGRLSTVTFGPYSTTYGYDAADRLATVQTADGEVVTYGYDGSLRVSETWTGPVSGSVAQTFDNYFRLSTRTVMGTSPVTYGYDGRSAQERGSALRSAGPRRPDERAPGGHDRGRSDRCVDLRLRRPTDELHGAVRRRYAVLRDVHAGPRRARLDEDRRGLGRCRARQHVHVHCQGRA